MNDPQYTEDTVCLEAYEKVRANSTMDREDWEQFAKPSECGCYIEVKGFDVEIDEDNIHFTAWAVDSIVSGAISLKNE